MTAGAPGVRFVLASASPARLATLRAAGADPEVIVSDVDEPALIAGAPGADPSEVVALLARAKAEDVASRLDVDPARITLVVGCDSMLDLDGTAYGKPASPDEARARWRQMRGRSGVLRTGHAVAVLSGGARRSDGAAPIDVGVSSTTVRFADVDDREIDAYVSTGEPLAVAGAFTLDGLGGWFVEALDGDHHGVVGISLPLLRLMLRSAGVTVAELWRTSAIPGV